jgi:U1 small nuclear ribonucleoprotein
MTRYLPPNVLHLFSARPAVEYAQPTTKRRMLPYGGVAQCMASFTNPIDEPPPEPLKLLTREERTAIKREKKKEKERQKIENEIQSWDPHVNPKATDEAFKTLFVCRLSYNTSESKLRREFEQFGPIKQVKMISDLDNKPRGYAFIEFERERDMRDAYKAADAKKNR